MKLVGSRSKGTHKENSDWDIFVPGLHKVGSTDYGGGFLPCPNWPEAVSGLDLAEIETAARCLFDIPTEHSIDLFFGAYCPDRNLYAIVTGSGYTVAMEDSWEKTEACAFR